MTQHRTREEKIRGLISDLQAMGNRSWVARDSCAAGHIDEAEARAMSALRAENERLREAMTEAYETYVGTPEDVADIDDRYERIGSILERALDGAPKMSSDRTDRERLDWLEEQDSSVIRSSDGCWSIWMDKLDSEPDGSTLRAAIDSAMGREGQSNE